MDLCYIGSLIVNTLNSDVKAWVLLSYFFHLLWVMCITSKSSVCLVRLELLVSTTLPKKSAFFSWVNLLNWRCHKVQTSLVIKWEFFVDWLHLSKNSTLGVHKRMDEAKRRGSGRNVVDWPREHWSGEPIKNQFYMSVKNGMWKMVLKWC